MSERQKDLSDRKDKSLQMNYFGSFVGVGCFGGFFGLFSTQVAIKFWRVFQHFFSVKLRPSTESCAANYNGNNFDKNFYLKTP